MESTALPDSMPFWTERVYRPGGGQDHLGLGSVVTDRILPRLAPAINVITRHPRYWSFYAFVLSEFWKRDLPRTRAAFRQWYEPLECIFAVACELCDNPEHKASPVGAEKIGTLVANDPAFYDPKFSYVESALGGYGLYYATTMQAVGLVLLPNRSIGLKVDTITPAGQIVAEAFRSMIVDTEYYTEWLDKHDAPVPASVVREYAQRACLCRLHDSDALDRPLLADVVLHQGQSIETASRRETFQMMCELVAQSKGMAIDQEGFRRLIYFGTNARAGDSQRFEFTPTPPTIRAARRWRLYQAREYYNAALNEMWRRLHYWGLGQDGIAIPIPLSKVFESVRFVDFDEFTSSFGVKLPSKGISGLSPIQSLLDWVQEVGQVTGGLDDRWNLDAPLTEDGVIGWLHYGRSVTEASSGYLAAALTLLALVACRLWSRAMALVEPEDWFPVSEGGVERLGIERFLAELRRRADEGQSIADLATWLTRDYVISQHGHVAAAKLLSTGDTYRFRVENDRLRFFDQSASVGMNNPRFESLATFMYELGWSDYFYDHGNSLTIEGELLRVNGDLTVSGLLETFSSEH